MTAHLQRLATRPGKKCGLAGGALLLLACASAGDLPHPALTATWREYRALPDERALAVAGDPDRVPWVAGMAGGYETRELAEAAAIRECRARRRARLLQVPCMLYALGDEIVWPVR